MKNVMLAWPMAAIIFISLGFALGRFVPLENSTIREMGHETPAPEQSTEPEILYWVAPMDPNFRRDGPGKSPMGMDLVPVYAETESGIEAESTSYPTGDHKSYQGSESR